MPERAALDRLVSDGLLSVEGGRLRPTRRYRAAIARAALRLRTEEQWDLRLPIAFALVELYAELPDPEIAALVDALLPIQRAELDPSTAQRPESTR